jgi:hypothetical protein
MWAVTAAEIFNFNISCGTPIIILSVHIPGRFIANFGNRSWRNIECAHSREVPGELRGSSQRLSALIANEIWNFHMYFGILNKSANSLQ